jgi:hypothetical protein
MRSVNTDRIEAAVSDALWAHVHRWEQHPVLALPLAKRAVERFDFHRRFESAGRAYCLVAEIAMDLAKGQPEGTAWNETVALAQRHVRWAKRAASDTGDTGLDDVAILSQARLSAVRGDSEIQIGRVENVIAKYAANPLVAAQAWTTLGELFASNNEFSSALTAYRQVAHALRGSDVYAFGVWAQRALIRYEQDPKHWVL